VSFVNRISIRESIVSGDGWCSHIIDLQCRKTGLRT